MVIDYDKEFPTKPKIMEQTQSRRKGQIYKIFLDLHIHHLILRTQSINKNHLKRKSMNVSGFWGEIPWNSCNTEMRWWDVHGRFFIINPATLGGFPYNQHHFLGWPTNQPGKRSLFFFCPGKRHDGIPKLVFLGGFFGENPSILNYLYRGNIGWGLYQNILKGELPVPRVLHPQWRSEDKSVKIDSLRYLKGEPRNQLYVGL